MRAIAAVVAIVASCAMVGCGKKASPLAELVKTDGPVDRQTGSGGWAAASIGTGFFLNDAARTADGGAQLAIAAGTAKIAMQPRTVLRFGAGGKTGGNKISVELGAIDLSGTGSYALDIGDVKLSRNGSVRITAKGRGESTLELTGGEAQVTSNGQTLDLAVGKTIELSLDVPTPGDAGIPIDAGAPDAPPPDAPEPIASGDTSVEITGKKVEIQDPGDKVWKAFTASGPIARGTKLRVGAGSTAKVTSGGATIELVPGSRVEIDADLAISVEAGGGKATTPINGAAKIIVPGGGLALKGNAQSGAEVHLDLARETKVTDMHATVKLTGATGAELELNRGESATIAKNGQIHPLEAIPTYVDFKVAVGETLAIHDPKGATAVQFEFGGKCPNGGVVELDHDQRFRSSKLSAGKDAANLMVSGGSWAYRLRCTTGGDEGNAVASGRIAVLRDDGRRALPKTQPTNDIDADGRNYRISYQSAIPSLRVLYKGPSGTAFKLHFASGGKEDTFDGGVKIVVPGTKLHEGTYTYWFDRDGEKDPKVSTLKIDFDQTAPQVYIESPVNGVAWTGDVDVRGAVLVGWTAAVDTITIPIDGQRRFAAKVAPPTGQNALAIKLSHPQRGVHYYLRRAK